MRSQGKIAVILLVGALGGGCAAVPKEAGFGDVRNTVAGRTGQVVQWRGHTAADGAVDAAVRRLLAKPLTADQAVQIALLNNLHLQATFEDLGIAQADLVQAGLLNNPVFFASVRFPDGAPRGTNSEFSVTQDFLDLFILPLRKRIAGQQFEATKLTVGREILQLAADVKTGYYTFQAREQLLTRLRLIAAINQAAAELAQRQHEADTLNELGAATQQAIYDQSRADVAQAQAQLAADRERLNRLLGLWGGQTTWKIAGQLPDVPAQEIPLEHLESLAIRQRLDLAATRTRLASLAQELAVTRNFRYLASVDLGIDTERETDGQRVTGPVLDLQVPIFDQGHARIARAEAQFRQFQERLGAMAIDARSQVREARDRMRADRNLAEYYKVLLPERIRILDLTLQQYNGMLKGPYDLLLAKQSEVATEQEYVKAWRDYWIARAQLELAVGGRLPRPVASASQPASPSTRPASPTTQPQAPMKPSHDMDNMKNMPGMKGM